MPASFSCARPWEANSIGEDVEQLKQRWPLLDYLQQQNWPPGQWVTTPSSSDSVRYTRKRGLRSMSTLVKISSTATVAVRVAI
jgi:hypothetical protein